MATVASLQATPSTVNCVAEMTDRVPHAEKEMPMASTQDVARGTSVASPRGGTSRAKGESRGSPGFALSSSDSALNSP